MILAIAFRTRLCSRGACGLGIMAAAWLACACSKSPSSPEDANSRPEVETSSGAAASDGGAGGRSGGAGGHGADPAAGGAGGHGADPAAGGAGGHGADPAAGGAGGHGADPAAGESAFEPPELPNLPLDGVAGVLTLIGSTLRPGADGLELYASLRNEGESPLCSAAMQVEFYDHSDALLGTVSAGVQSGRLYRLPDGSRTLWCVAPGQTAMVAATSLPENLKLDELKSLGHRFPAFHIDGAVPVPLATVSELEAFEVAGGIAFRGTVVNESDRPISDPAVSVFPVNSVGRPLGVAPSAAAVEIQPGASWAFETDPVAERGADQVAIAVATYPEDE